MYGNLIVDENATFKKFGYLSSDLDYSSNKNIIVKCDNCNKIHSRQKNESHQRHLCKIIKRNKKRCYLCKKWKNFNLYAKNHARAVGVGSMCQKCRETYTPTLLSNKKLNERKRSAIKNNDMEFYFKIKISGMKTSCARKNIIIDIDSKFLLNLWNNQQGKCYYTEILMNKSMCKGSKRVAWDSPSIDRLEPNKGYTKNNVVLCLFSVNAFKGDLTENEFKNKLRNIKWKL